MAQQYYLPGHLQAQWCIYMFTPCLHMGLTLEWKNFRFLSSEPSTKILPENYLNLKSNEDSFGISLELFSRLQ